MVVSYLTARGESQCLCRPSGRFRY